jgi:DNA polymerase-3 subunit gamma/tau
MSYKALHLKYRPKKLSQLCGQKHLVRSFTNMFDRQQVPQSFLFQGMWGGGKTTTARILGMMLNCDKGMTSDPCGECGSCQKIINESTLDIIEIDAAAHGGIDGIRKLKENARYAPSELRCKLIILDECHRLTKAACESLLKLLEEPPSHVYMVLATTEPRELLPTIHSRCQIYEFKKVSPQETFDYLCKICKEEGLEYEDNALRVIAKISNGSMRDSLKNLQKLKDYSEGKILEKDSYEAFGVANSSIVFDLIDRIIDLNATEGIIIINEVANSGVDLVAFLKEISGHIRDLLVVKTCRDTSVISCDESTLARFKEQAGKTGTNLLLSMNKIFEKALSNTVFNLSAQQLLEVSFIEAIIKANTDAKKRSIKK